ncbi:hypothetical protein BELL_0219g00050 [Botrytis elliptica]|uniref:Uncharacterized protein n=1 Tax=Botrytis elliptica TaxID=278938 RepID=A0A4Z1JUQ4_9HELO|nr:hypothetical protein BELL_0219g00050 [Botrytis elliptica]
MRPRQDSRTKFGDVLAIATNNLPLSRENLVKKYTLNIGKTLTEFILKKIEHSNSLLYTVKTK